MTPVAVNTSSVRRVEMKPPIFFLIFFLFSLLLICGCTSDPAKGGFFDGLYGLSSGKYEERQKEKQDELNRIEENTVELDEENVALKKKHQELEQLRQNYTADLRKLEKDLDQMEIELTRVHVLGESGLNQKRILEQKLADLKRKVEHEKKFASNSNEAQMRDELERLMKDKKRLQEQIQHLQSM
jgi:hypothetical protein